MKRAYEWVFLYQQRPSDWSNWLLLITGSSYIIVSVAERRNVGVSRFWNKSFMSPPPLRPRHFLAADFFRGFGITTIATASIGIIPYLYASAQRRFGPTQLAISLACALVACGWSAYKFKQKNQFWYGFTEASVAVMYIIHTCFRMASIDSVVTNWGPLVGLVYFFARGLTNLSEGKTKRRAQLIISSRKESALGRSPSGDASYRPPQLHDLRRRSWKRRMPEEGL
jgi:hypothetical protein